MKLIDLMAVILNESINFPPKRRGLADEVDMDNSISTGD